ncbi:MAG: DUF5693 family protein [Bacillota bacterium]
MKRLVVPALWIVFAISAVMSFTGVYIRHGNESANKSVIPVFDYDGFYAAAGRGGMDINNVMAQLKEAGVRTAAVRERSDGTGFDTNFLDHLKTAGFDILLMPRNSPSPDESYFSHVEEVIRDFGVKLIIFEGEEVSGYPGGLDAMAGIISRNNIIVGIIEPVSQIGYVRQKGLERLMPETGYAVNRVYVTPEPDLARLSGDAIFHRWLRCVVDRNIRLIYIDPLENPGIGQKENIHQTIDAIKRLNEFISKKGYAVNSPIPKLSDRLPGWPHYLAVSLSLLFASLLYLVYFFDLRTNLAVLLAVFGAISAAAAGMLFGIALAQAYALLAALLYPSFSTFMLLRLLKDNREKPAATLVFSAMGTWVGINALGMYTVVTSLADIRYTMNIELFRGVLVSYFLPLAVYVVNYLKCFMNRDRFRRGWELLNNRRNLCLAGILTGVVLLAVAIYLVRSGTSSVIPASDAERRIKDILEVVFVARPRFKEFLIGYPALFAMVYLYKRYGKDIVLLPLGIGVAMGGVSMVNSFCHVFTPIEVSALRTLNALLLGIVAGLVVLLVLKLALDAWDKIIAGNKSRTAPDD